MIFRKVKKEDYNRLLEIYNEIHDYHTENRGDIYKKGCPLPKEYFDSLFEDDKKLFWCVEDNSQVVGVCLCTDKNTDGHPLKQPRRILFIENIGVKEEFKSKGIGRFMFGKISEFAEQQKFDTIELCVWSFNDSAKIFYEKMGFTTKSLTLEYILKDKNEVIENYWKEFAENHNIKNQRYVDYYSFEIEQNISDRLAELVLQGKKTATSCLYDGERLPKIGDYNIITKFDGTPVCVVQTTGVIVMPFKDFTFDIVKLEGEDENLQSWRNNHIEFFSKCNNGKKQNFENELIVFEIFKKID